MEWAGGAGLHQTRRTSLFVLFLCDMAARMPIALLKTKSSPTDPYDEYFSTHPFSNSNGHPSHPIFVPVLKHQYVNLDRLEKLVMGGHTTTTTTTTTATATATAGTTVTTATTARGEGAGEGGYAGLIITSQRAVEALRSVLEKLRGIQCTSPGIGKGGK